MSDVQWVGLDQGHGHLQARQATVSVRKGTAPAQSKRLWFPDGDRRMREVEVDCPDLRRVG